MQRARRKSSGKISESKIREKHVLAKIVVCAPDRVLHRAWSAHLCARREAGRRLDSQGSRRGRREGTAPRGRGTSGAGSAAAPGKRPEGARGPEFRGTAGGRRTGGSHSRGCRYPSKRDQRSAKEGQRCSPGNGRLE